MTDTTNPVNPAAKLRIYCRGGMWWVRCPGSWCTPFLSFERARRYAARYIDETH